MEDVLWKAADKLRGAVDAAQYKDFVLGLVFLKYVSDSSGEGDFVVPDGAHWADLTGSSGDLGARIDAAMDAVMRANPSLGGALPKIFTGVDQRRLGELVDLLGEVRFGGKAARDVLGEVYEYFLEKFARAEGKRGGEFYTPPSVVRLLVEILEPFKGRVYDPCCGSGGMFVQAEKFVLSHRGRLDDIAVYGQEANERTWRLAKMNLAVHGISGDLGRSDTFHADAHPNLQADYVLANPRSTRRTGIGTPPTRAGDTASRPPGTPISRGSSTSFPNSDRLTTRASSWRTAPCRPGSRARA